MFNQLLVAALRMLGLEAKAHAAAEDFLRRNPDNPSAHAQVCSQPVAVAGRGTPVRPTGIAQQGKESGCASPQTRVASGARPRGAGVDLAQQVQRWKMWLECDPAADSAFDGLSRAYEISQLPVADAIQLVATRIEYMLPVGRGIAWSAEATRHGHHAQAAQAATDALWLTLERLLRRWHRQTKQHNGSSPAGLLDNAGRPGLRGTPWRPGGLSAPVDNLRHPLHGRRWWAGFMQRDLIFMESVGFGNSAVFAAKRYIATEVLGIRDLLWQGQVCC